MPSPVSSSSKDNSCSVVEIPATETSSSLTCEVGGFYWRSNAEACAEQLNATCNTNRFGVSVTPFIAVIVDRDVAREAREALASPKLAELR